MAELALKTNPLEPQFARAPEFGFIDKVQAGFQSEFATSERATFGRKVEVFAPWRPTFERIMSGDLEIPPDLQQSLAVQSFDPDEKTLRELAGYLTEQGEELTEDMDPDAVFARRGELLAKARADVDEAGRVLGEGGGLGGFIGQVGGTITDPINVATLPFGASARAGLLVTAGVEGLINAAVEGLDTARRNEALRELGLPETSLLQNMLVGGAFGVVFGGGMKGAQIAAPKVGRLAVDASRSVTRAVAGLVRSPGERRAVAQALAESEDPALSTLAQQVIEDADEADLATAGGQQTVEALTEHETRMERAAEAIESGAEPDMPDRPISAVPRGSILNGALQEVEANKLKIDPKRWQFKSDADEKGVTDKLREVRKWRNELSGTVIVYEDLDGTLSIVDGHQRTSLAQRIMAEDPSQDIRLAATIYRAADGFEPDTVRQLAAIKNISEAADGMTTAMARDAAKVLRVDPAAIQTLPRGPGIGRAQDLMSLSDDAFGLVINDVVPDNFAALVGRLVQDKALHMPIMRLLERTKPSSAVQAEAVVRQALATPVEREVTEDLFGTSETVDSLFIERAKVLERTMKVLREDDRTFRTLTERGDTIEGRAANKLDAAGNAENRKRIEEALVAISKLAYRAGPISEALDNGAKTYRQSGRLGDAAGAVVSAINAELERGGLSGLGAGNAGRAAEPARASATAPDPNAEFGEPGGAGQTAQIANTRLEPTAEVDATAEGRKVAAEVAAAIEPNWRPYMVLGEGDELIPLSAIVSEKMRPEGVRNAVPFMQQAARGEIDKRPALALRDNGDGTYTVRDGNSTLAIAQAAGWSEIPAKVLTDAEFRTEQARKAISRIFDTKLKKDKKRTVVKSDLPRAEFDALEEQLKQAQPHKTFEELMQAAEEWHVDLQLEMQKVADAVGVEFTPAPVKKFADALRKVRTKYDGDHKLLADVARSGFSVRNTDDIKKAIKLLGEKYHIIDEGMTRTPQGYIDNKIMIRFDDGTLGEVQFWPPDMFDAKENRGGHKAYEIWRDPTQPQEARDAADAFMRELYGEVEASLEASFAEALSKTGSDAPRSASTSPASSGDSSIAPSSSRMALAMGADGAPAGRQPEPPSNLATDRSSESAAIEPKSNRNTRIDGSPSGSNVNPDAVNVKGGDSGADQVEVETVKAGIDGVYRVTVGRERAELNIAPAGPYASSVKVPDGLQRQGIATALYDAAERDLGRRMMPSPLGLSQEATGFWIDRLSKIPKREAIALLDEAQANADARSVGKSATTRLAPIRQKIEALPDDEPTPTPDRQSEQTPAGSQLLIDGVRPISAREQVQMAADRPLLAPTRTTDTEIGGLFDANDPARFDLFDQVPVGTRTEADGTVRAETVSREDLARELDDDDEFADQIGVCL